MMRPEASEFLAGLFSLEDRVAVVTGGTGVLGGAIAGGLARAGARVAVLGRREERAEEVARGISASGGEAMALPADVLERDRLESARDDMLGRWGRVDILVNAAGGNVPAATVGEDEEVFGLPEGAFREVLDLNLVGTLLPSQVFGEAMVRGTGASGEGCIVNVSSMASQRAITRVVGYSAAKAAVENLTRWLAIELARKHGSGLRVNAVAPGFFVGEQNRALLLNEDGSFTERGEKIIAHTPASRFGEPEELIGTLIWLCSPAARFVNGVIIPVDGGFDAYSGI